MIKIYIVRSISNLDLLQVEDLIGALYTYEEALRFISEARDIYKQDVSDWEIKEVVLGNNADKFAKAMFSS